MQIRKKVIYVAGPYRAKARYLEFSNLLSMYSWALLVWQVGGIAIAPLLNTWGMDDAVSCDEFIDGDCEIVRRCDAVLMTGAWQESIGALREKKTAEEVGIPVFTMMSQIRDFVKGA